MMTLNLTEREAELLQTLLQRFIEETRSEIHHTDADPYKNRLKGEVQTAEEVQARLTAKPTAA